MELSEKKIELENIDQVALLGFNDIFLNMIENRFKSRIMVRGNTISIKGIQEEIDKIEKILKEMLYTLGRNKALSEHDVKNVIELIDNGPADKTEIRDETQNINKIIYQGVRDTIRARTARQIDYVNKVNDNDLVFSIGPAGTGKTFLAVALALAALRKNQVNRIILSRPAVEAGESLGFLPGDLREKIDPYLKPLTDALQVMLTGEKMNTLIEKNIIEITPLAYMRGRTLNKSFIILDEAQNATATQMKMFLTRLGEGSKAVITGDVTQIDLPGTAVSGLVHARKVLQNISGIEFVYFDSKDVVRHKLVADIIRAYEIDEQEKEFKKSAT